MSPTHVVRIALTGAVLSFIVMIIAALIAVDQLSLTTGLWVRVVLVAVSLVVVAVYWTSRLPVRRAPGLTLFFGLLLAWALNPQSWIGRSYAGQLLATTGVPSAAFDLVCWAMTAAVIAYVVDSRTDRNPR